jgi:hypothetical protein
MADQLTQIKSCSLGTGVRSVQWNDSGTSVKTKADANVYATGQKRTAATVTVTVTFQDQEQAQAVAMGVEATLTAVGVQVNGASDVTLTVLKFMPLSVSPTLNHDTEGTATVTGEATSADGTTSPVSLASA